jgi:hypothetical protein
MDSELLRLSDWHSHIVISSQRPGILTEVLRDFPQRLQANAGIVP